MRRKEEYREQKKIIERVQKGLLIRMLLWTLFTTMNNYIQVKCLIIETCSKMYATLLWQSYKRVCTK